MAWPCHKGSCKSPPDTYTELKSAQHRVLEAVNANTALLNLFFAFANIPEGVQPENGYMIVYFRGDDGTSVKKGAEACIKRLVNYLYG